MSHEAYKHNEEQHENFVDADTAAQQAESKKLGEDPSPNVGLMPVIRPAVTLPDPDAEAPQRTPSLVELEPQTHEQVPVPVLSHDDSPTAPIGLRDVPEPAEHMSDWSEQDSPDTRKFPALTTWGRAFRQAAGTRRTDDAALHTDVAHFETDTASVPYTEPLPTQAIRLADRLQDSPYQLTGARYKAVAEAKDAHNTMLLGLKLGETMFSFGAGALEVETSIIVITQAYGVFDAEVDITNQAISLNFAPPGSPPATYQRVVRTWGSDYAGLADLHKLVTGIAAGEVERDDAHARLAAIRQRKKTFPNWVSLLANGGWASAFVIFIGGSWLSAALTIGSSVLIMATVYLMSKWRASDVFATMSGAVVATIVAFGLYWADIFRDPALMIAASLLLLVPSLRIVSAIQDGINGFPVTSAGRIVASALIYVGLVAGIVIGVVAFSMLGAPEIDMSAAPVQHRHPGLITGIVAFAAMSMAVADQTRVRLILPTGIVSAVGYLAYMGALELGLGPSIAPAAAAVVVGFLARIVALSLGAPQLVIAVPASIFLLPGLMIFRAMYEIGTNVDMMSDGVAVLLQASVIVLAMATGLVLGDALAKPLTSGLKSNERRRAGSR